MGIYGGDQERRNNDPFGHTIEGRAAHDALRNQIIFPDSPPTPSGPGFKAPPLTPEEMRFFAAALSGVPVGIAGGIFLAWLMRSQGIEGKPVIVAWLTGTVVIWGLATWIFRTVFDSKPLRTFATWTATVALVYWVYTSPSADGPPRVLFTIVAAPVALIGGFVFVWRRSKLLSLGLIATVIALVYYFAGPITVGPPVTDESPANSTTKRPKGTPSRH
jgi:hypothetical protein